MILVCGRGVPSAAAPLLGIFELDQAKALREAGHDVVYAALDVRSVRRWRRWGLRHHDVDGVPVVSLDFPLGRLPRGINRRAMTLLWDVLLRAVVDRHGPPDVLHGHFLPWTAPLAGRRVARRVPLVVTEHWSRLREAPSTDIRALGRAVYPRAAAVLAVSRPLAEVINREFGVTARVVPDIVDVDTFGAVVTARREPGVRLVATGNLIARKNFDGLLRAFAAAAPESARLTVIGQGPEQAALEQLATALGIAERVLFTGRLSRAVMTAEYARATGFALTSHAETFGVVWAEALAAGLPVLATRCGGPEDFVGPGNGVLVEDTPGDLALGVAELCSGIANSRWPAAGLHAGVRERFSAEAVVGQLAEVYAGL